MAEKEIIVDVFNPIEIFGVNDAHVEILRKHFPKLKIIVRGENIKLIGDDEEIVNFENKLGDIIKYYDKFGNISAENITDILDNIKDIGDAGSENNPSILLHGRNGLIIKAKTPNQVKMVESITKNDMLFAVGPAGTGKTYTAVGCAVKALKNKEVRRIVLTRPAVEAGENLGFLPGDLKDKLDPYLQPLYDALWDMLPAQKLDGYIEDGIIEIAPLAFMRGRTLDNAFVILDEGQNATINQMKMFLTRMGKNAKFIITGDITQVDLPRNQKSGLIHSLEILKDIDGLDIIMLDERDVIRHRLVSKIINAYSKAEPV